MLIDVLGCAPGFISAIVGVGFPVGGQGEWGVGMTGRVSFPRSFPEWEIGEFPESGHLSGVTLYLVTKPLVIPQSYNLVNPL